MDRSKVAQIAKTLGFCLLEDSNTHDWRFDVPATSGKQYRVAQRRNTQAWECDCPSWKFAKKDANGQKPNCKHLNDLMPILALVLSSGGSSVAIDASKAPILTTNEEKKTDKKLGEFGQRRIG